MGRLVLVRHGRGSFFESNYDRLGPTGETQAQLLGEYWSRIGLEIDAVETGPRERHRRTAEAVGDAYSKSGRAWPAPTVVEGWDENSVVRVIQDPEGVGALSSAYPEVASLARSYASAETDEERGRGFQRLFEEVTRLWMANAFKAPGIAPWPAFRAGIEQEIRRITNEGRRGRMVVVFTSAGPIAAALRLATRCGEAEARAMGWRVRNASLTELLFAPGMLTLDSFNGVPHLDDPELWTYR